MNVRPRAALAALSAGALAFLAPSALAGALGSRHGQIAIQEMRVRAHVEEGLVTTELEQQLRNDAAEADEAVYDLPLPDRATFAGLSVWVDGREIQGELVSRARAEAVYGDVTGVQVAPPERARRTQPAALRAPARATTPERERPRVTFLRLPPKDPGLLELLHGRTLRLRLAPVPANGTYRVKVRWVQPTVVRGGRGRLVIPFTPAAGAEGALAERFLTNVLVGGAAGGTLAGVTAPSHPAASITDLGGGEAWGVDLAAGATRLERDLEVGWDAPRGDGPTVAVAAARDAGGPGTALLSITPWLAAGAKRPARDVVVAIDASPSMQPRARDAYAAAEKVLRELGPEDRFDVVVMGLGARTCHGELVAANEVARERGLAFYWAARAGTQPADPRAALRALRALRGKAAPGGALRPLDLVLITDAGLSRDDGLLRALEVPARDAGVRLSALELGADRTTRAPLSRLARATGGVALPVPAGAGWVSGGELAKALAAPALFRPRLTLEGVELTDVQPATTPTVLTEGTQVHVLGRYARPGRGAAVLEATLADGRAARWSVPVELPALGRHPEVARLWAQAAADEVEAGLHRPGLSAAARQALGEELERVSLAGPVLTRATALLVLDAEEAFQRYGIDRRNKDLVGAEEQAEQARLLELDARLEQRRREAEQRALPADDVVAQAPPRVQLWGTGGGGLGGFGGGFGGGGFGGGGGGGAGEPLLLLAGGAAAAGAWLRRRRTNRAPGGAA